MSRRRRAARLVQNSIARADIVAFLLRESGDVPRAVEVEVLRNELADALDLLGGPEQR